MNKSQSQALARSALTHCSWLGVGGWGAPAEIPGFLVAGSVKRVSLAAKAIREKEPYLLSGWPHIPE